MLNKLLQFNRTLYFIFLFISGFISIGTFHLCKTEFKKIEHINIEIKKETVSTIPSTYKSTKKISQIDFSGIKLLQDINKCMRQHSNLNDHFNCRSEMEKMVQVKPASPKKQTVIQNNKEDDFKKTLEIEASKSLAIKGIEIFLQICLALQIFLTFCTYHPKKFSSYNQYVFHISDWAINTPPILGVLANLVSFALALTIAHKYEKNIQDVFDVYFFQAVITTLIGGFFYIINLFLKIRIHPYIET